MPHAIIPATLTAKTTIGEYEETNTKVRKGYKKKVADPYTYVAGLTTTSLAYVDISTGAIRINPKFKPNTTLTKDVLVHENGHRTIMPVETLNIYSIEDIVVKEIKDRKLPLDPEILKYVMNIVDDILVDTTAWLLKVEGFPSKEYIKTLENMFKEAYGSPAGTLRYIQVQYIVSKGDEEKAIEKAKHLPFAKYMKDFYKQLLIEIGGIAGYIKDTAPTLERYTLQQVALLVANLYELEILAQQQIESGGEGSQGQLNRRAERWGEGFKKAVEEAREKQGAEKGDVLAKILKVVLDSTSDVNASLPDNFPVALDGFPEDSPLFQEHFDQYVSSLLSKFAIIFRGLERRVLKTMKDVEKPVLPPHIPLNGEPVEEDVLLEPRKPYNWRTRIKKTREKGKTIEQESLPKEIVLVKDESGSTYESLDPDYGSLSVRVAESIIASAFAYVFRRNGVKKLYYIPFSDRVEREELSKKGLREVVKKVLKPFEYAGHGTNIIGAVDRALSVSKKSALFIITDLQIGPDTAEIIARRLDHALSTGKVDFLVFIIVLNKPTLEVLETSGNENIIYESLEILKRLEAKKPGKVIVQVMSSVEDLNKLTKGLFKKVLSAYAKNA